MNEEIREYISYLSRFVEIKKPQMPNFDVSAYDDYEYISAIEKVELDFINVDDVEITLKHLKGN